MVLEREEMRRFQRQERERDEIKSKGRQRTMVERTGIRRGDGGVRQSCSVLGFGDVSETALSAFA